MNKYIIYLYCLFILFNDSLLYATESMFGNKLIFRKLIEFNTNFKVKKTSGPLQLVSNIKTLFAETQKEMNNGIKL